MIAAHGGNIICARLTESLWLRFLQRSGKLSVFDVQKIMAREDKISEQNVKNVEEGNWRESTLPPPMPLLPATTHFV